MKTTSPEFAAEQAKAFGMMVRADLGTARTWARLGHSQDAKLAIQRAAAYAAVAWGYARDAEAVNAQA